MHAGDAVIEIKTLDVSEHGFGVIAAKPVKIGKARLIVFQSIGGAQVANHKFSCATVYRILAAITGFRIGLHIADADDVMQKNICKKLLPDGRHHLHHFNERSKIVAC